MFLKFKTYNEGQYGLKPWMANVIMGIVELILVLLWLFGSVITGLGAILSFDIDIVEGWDAGTGFVLAALYLIWNILVWSIKPLRTHFNHRESLWNLLFIAWLIFDGCRLLMGS